VQLWWPAFCNASWRACSSTSGGDDASSSGKGVGDDAISDSKDNVAGDTSEAAEASIPAAEEAGEGASGQATEPSSQALFAMPLYRKPAFPGFYHIIQIGDQELLDFLHAMRRNGQPQYLGGFMTKELPKGFSDSDAEVAEPLVSVPPVPVPADKSSAENQPKSLRRDTGRVDSGEDLEDIGTLLQIISLAAHPSVPGGQVVVMPSRRIRMLRTLSKPSPGNPLCAVYTEDVADVEVPAQNESVRALHHEIIATMKDLLKTPFMYKDQFEQVIKYYNLDNPLKLADLVAGMSTAPRDELQAVLVEDDAVDRLKKVLMLMKKDLEHAKMQSQFKTQMEDKFAKEHRKYVLMQHLRHIKRELNLEKDDKQSIIAAFKEAIEKLEGVPEEATKAFESELGRLGHLETQSPEFNVTRTYLEWMTALPWGKTTEENKDIEKAEAILNEDHFSLEDVKERILEHMAVSFLKGSIQGKIMCLVGPPGVGKTSIGKSIARALDRKFFRFSVGGLHDVAEIRGHRRTYVGAMPGKIIQALKITQVSNPVILIDEVDKLGRDYRGDPSSALLEILDPSQNAGFRDMYLDVPIDLSRVLFVCTANIVDSIPAPLLDRMEVIRIAGYVFEEKCAIANQYLIPQTIGGSGVNDDHLELNPEAVNKLIRDYARESGVRELRKLLEKITRKIALNIVRDEAAYNRTVVSMDNLTDFVGQPPYSSDRMFHDNMPAGTVMGLAWTALGGKTLFVEARGRVPPELPALEPPKKQSEEHSESEKDSTPVEDTSKRRRPPGSGPRMKVTGKLGKVMSESSEIALTYARMFVQEVEPSNVFLEEAAMHVHVPEGATPKDGPSAGVTMTSALLSLALDRPVKHDMAMTGEMTLTGKVLPVGGIKEKAIAAKRENIDMIVLPMSNHAEYMDLKPGIRAGLTAHFVDHYDDVYRLAFEDSGAPMPSVSRGSEIRTVFTPPEEAMAIPAYMPAKRSTDQDKERADSEA
jgi:Lon-like ATP-dependent protease